MSALKKYLDDNHPNPDKSDNHPNPDKRIVSDFMEKFGVNVKQEDDLYLFKYGMISVKWDDVTHECRGAILRPTKKGWEFLARPFDKFFNQHEGHCPVFEAKEFERRMDNLRLVEKADGSCIHHM